ncbi:MAG: hypothetical protein ACM3VS_14555 [Candidatus Dadabacteria bacterium]
MNQCPLCPILLLLGVNRLYEESDFIQFVHVLTFAKAIPLSRIDILCSQFITDLPSLISTYSLFTIHFPYSSLVTHFIHHSLTVNLTALTFAADF